MRWNLRLRAAERGIWKSTEMRRRLAEYGLEVSAGKMSALWTTTPTTIRLDDLDVICAVLDCSPTDLLIREPEQVQARRTHARKAHAVGDNGQADEDAPGAPGASPPAVTPRLGRNRSVPPA